jgi:cytochrome c oxidase subunit IV
MSTTDHADPPVNPGVDTDGRGPGSAVNVDGTYVIPGAEHRGADHKDSFYVQVAVILAVLTGLEVSISYIDIGPVFLPLLLVLMVIKFFMVVLFFMHLKFDSKWFSFFFYAGLVLAVGVYVAALATFKFFVD